MEGLKLPNGFGSVYKLSGNRRRPYIARRTIGWDDEGKQQYVTLGYYATRQEGLQALADYNNDPYDLVMSKTTFADIYAKWSEVAFENLSASAIRNYTTPYKACSALYNMPMGNIRTHHMQRVIDESGKNPQSMRRIRILFNQIFRYCIEREYVRKNYAEYLKIPSTDDPHNEKQPFSPQEIQSLWDNVHQNEYIPLVLILIYSGVRISELLDLRKEDVHLDEQWFRVRAAKTNAGIRIVPIADKVLPFWRSFMEHSHCPYAVSTTDGKKHLSYDNFKKRYWFPLMEQMGMNHLPHETRHTCISRLVINGVNQTIIKKIVGHKSIMNLTEKVYTHIEIKELIEAINRL